MPVQGDNEEGVCVSCGLESGHVVDQRDPKTLGAEEEFIAATIVQVHDNMIGSCEPAHAKCFTGLYVLCSANLEPADS